MILKDSAPVHVHNPKKNKRKHGGVVISEPKQTILVAANIRFTYLFILVGKKGHK